MSDLNPVTKPPFLLEGRGARVLTVVVIAVLIAVVKPWGLSEPNRSAAVPSPSSTPVASETPRPTLDVGDGVSRPYDPLIFGDKELQPTWGLWPAGYLVTFGFAMHTESSNAPGASGASAVPSAAESDTNAPIWPDAIDIPIGNHLLLIGVSTPRGYRVETITLTRQTAGGGTEEVPVVRPTSPWPTHFTVIGIDSGRGPDRPAFWTPGIYELDLAIEPGAIRRSVDVRVERPAASPSPSASPGGLKP